MKLTFEIKSITLAEARDKADDLLAAIKDRRRLDRLDVAEVCAYVLEPRRKSAEGEKPGKEGES